MYFAYACTTGTRAVRISDQIEEKIARRGRLTTEDLGEIQADTVMDDALVFTPEILQAFPHASKRGAHPALAELAADPRIAEAVSRLSAWDQSTPTGIRQGFDASDTPGRLREPRADEIADSVAATIYSVWRNQFLRGNALFQDSPDAFVFREGPSYRFIARGRLRGTGFATEGSLPAARAASWAAASTPTSSSPG